MNLKESYTYANHLSRLLTDAYQYLGNHNFITKTKENHLRSKANKDAEDEIVEVQNPYDVDFMPNDVINLVVKVIEEEDKLNDAITIAKNKADMNRDNAIASNKRKQAFVSILNRLANIKPRESVCQEKGYKFDVNGEQKPYVYDVVKTTTIDFDRNDVKALIKKYNKECDKVSAELDKSIINTIVDFEPSFDVNDTFEDTISNLS